MNICIKWLDNHPRFKQWMWLMVLWLAGLITTLVLTLPFKLLIHWMK